MAAKADTKAALSGSQAVVDDLAWGAPLPADMLVAPAEAWAKAKKITAEQLAAVASKLPVADGSLEPRAMSEGEFDFLFQSGSAL
jgi:hypothetical protein